MKVTEFAVKVAKAEGGKKEVNIAQVMDVLKAVNKLIPCGFFYALIKAMK